MWPSKNGQLASFSAAEKPALWGYFTAANRPFLSTAKKSPEIRGLS
jgi:hypothetical protein